MESSYICNTYYIHNTSIHEPRVQFQAYITYIQENNFRLHTVHTVHTYTSNMLTQNTVYLFLFLFVLWVGYVYRDKVSLFSVSRLLFCKFWCKLNVMTSCRDTLLSVCKTFETLLLQTHPNLFMHLVAINLQPLKVSTYILHICMYVLYVCMFEVTIYFFIVHTCSIYTVHIVNMTDHYARHQY